MRRCLDHSSRPRRGGRRGLGGDTDTVAAVTGALAGARYGQGAVPEAWTAALHVPLPGFGDRVLDADGLRTLAQRLAAAGPPAAAGSR
ncbi:ADP-ribosylglycohydrolase family protein [Streptomyces sp. NPDC091273]|uniref:ADP-ribosylglycohydrolase family protein n=1 Tax=Streptomyces sp. NPDC091273 TaxID=3365982 RepID=UPI0038207517